MDQASARIIPDALSASQRGGLLAPTLAECRSNLQQPARRLVRRIVASVPGRRRESRLARQSHSARDTEEFALVPDGENAAVRDATDNMMSSVNEPLLK